MDRMTYLEDHHQITESILSLVSIQTDIAGVKKVLELWKPKLHEVIIERTKTVCLEGGVDWEDIKSLFSFTKDA